MIIRLQKRFKNYTPYQNKKWTQSLCVHSYKIVLNFTRCAHVVPKAIKKSLGKNRNPLKSMVRSTGVEPVAYCLGGNRSIRLSYDRIFIHDSIANIYFFVKNLPKMQDSNTCSFTILYFYMYLYPYFTKSINYHHPIDFVHDSFYVISTV